MGVGNIGFGFKFPPTMIIAKPQQLAVAVGHLTRDADLVGMEIGEVLLAAFGVVKDLG